MTTNRVDLISKLDRATNRALAIAIDKQYPIQLSRKTTVIGNLLIEKNSKGFYDVCRLSRDVIFEDIIVYDVAVTLAQKYSAGEKSAVSKILALEEKYAKHHSDMVFYLYNLKSALKRKDFERALILEDKFQVSESLAKEIKDRLFIFKRMK